MNRNQLYRRVITALICNEIVVHYMTGMIIPYGDRGNSCNLDIFIYKERYSLYTFDDKHRIIHKYVK